MKNNFKLTVAVFFTVLNIAMAHAANVSTMQWRVAEIVLTSSKTYSNPIQDVDVTATFIGPNNTVITRPAFWDGGTTWRIRFAPTLVGNWNYSTTCTDPTNTGLHFQTGNIESTAYTGNLDIYKKGFIKVSANKRYMVYNDESPFFWLGDTHWQMFDYERDNECNYGDNCGSQFKHVVKDRMAKGFNVYQTYPDAGVNDGGGNVHVVNWWSTKYNQLNPTAFQEYFDPKMEYLADNGFVVALGCGVHWLSTESVGLLGLKQLAKYMVARYGAYPIVWITAQEVDIKPAEETIWKEVAKTIVKYDGYKHPLTGHLSPKRYTWGDETWHTWFAVQGGHGASRTYCSQALYKSYWDYLPTQPFLESEAKYEDVDCDGLNDATDERVAAYKSIQCGSFGFTYGVSGIWAMKWDVKVAGWDSYSKYPWYVGVDAPGSSYMQYLKQFYTAFAWENLVPRFSDPAWCSFVNPETSVLSSSTDANRYVVYFYGASKSTGSLKKLDDSKIYCARWFDPTTGNSTLISEAISTSGGIYQIPTKPDNNDWLLLVENVNEISTLPLGVDKPISLGKVATTSSSSAAGFTGIQAIDNSPRTYWCAANGSFPQWLSVDLGVKTNVSFIETKFYANQLWKYKIEGSLDKSSWSLLVDYTQGKEGYIMKDTVNVNFRHIRMMVTGASIDWAAIREFSVYKKTDSNTGFDLNNGQSDSSDFLESLSVFPNPVRANTNICFNLKQPTQAGIQIFNSQGEMIKNLGSMLYSSGKHSVLWDASQQANGLYFAHLKVNEQPFSAKILLVK